MVMVAGNGEEMERKKERKEESPGYKGATGLQWCNLLPNASFMEG